MQTPLEHEKSRMVVEIVYVDSKRFISRRSVRSLLKSLDYNWFKNTLNGNDEERLTQRSDYSLSEWAASSELFEIASCIEIPQPTLNALVNENIAKRDEKGEEEGGGRR
uniref:Uncharacterized protein n=1 Tax=Vespula pensylvanica TaxID=30213 RepID=A0A834JL47_VESPE|nr:hypothetical protein H0235_017663 [Vespula pensylvanica]